MGIKDELMKRERLPVGVRTTSCPRGAICMCFIVGLALALVFGLGGCASTPASNTVSSSSAPKPSVAGSTDHPIPIPTHSGLNLAASTVPLLLQSDGVCFWLGGRNGTALSRAQGEPISWPSGYTARSDPPRILDEQGKVVAQAGQVVVMGGGGVPLDSSDQTGCLAGHKTIWLASDVSVWKGPLPT